MNNGRKTFYQVFFLHVIVIFSLSACDDSEKKTGWIQKGSPFEGYIGNYGTVITYNFVAGGKLYIGWHNSTVDKMNWQVFELRSNNWTNKNDFPLLQNRFSGFSASDNEQDAFIGLGYTYKEPLSSGELEIYDDVWRFNIESQQWSQLPDFPGDNIPRDKQPAAAFVVDGNLYVIPSGYSECWAFILSEKKWVQRNPPGLSAELRKIMAAKAFTYDGSGYLVFGGRWGSEGILIYKYSPENDEWSKVFEEDIAAGLWERQLFVLNDHLFMGGSFLWSKYDLRSMTHVDYFSGWESTPISAFSTNSAGYVLYVEGEFWQYTE